MVDDSDNGGDTVRGESTPITILRDSAAGADLGHAATGVGLTPLPLPPVPSIDRTRRDSPSARNRGDIKLLPTAADSSRYRFGAVLGEGGMGEVLLAHD